MIVKKLTFKQEDRKYLEEIKRIDKSLWGEGGINDWLLMPLVKSGLVLIALDEKNDGLLGYALFYREVESKDTLFLYDFVISPQFQNRGYGKSFFYQMLLYLKNHFEVDYLELTVSPKNIKALRIYRDLGKMEEVLFSPDFYGKGEDRIWLKGKIDKLIENFIF